MLSLYVVNHAGSFSHQAVDLHSLSEYYDLYGPKWPSFVSTFRCKKNLLVHRRAGPTQLSVAAIFDRNLSDLDELPVMTSNDRFSHFQIEIVSVIYKV